MVVLPAPVGPTIAVMLPGAAVSLGGTSFEPSRGGGRDGAEGDGEDGGEGARYKNVFGTYSHGPLLPKNPAFCDHILLTALERKYGAAELAPLDDTAERAAHDEVLARLG